MIRNLIATLVIAVGLISIFMSSSILLDLFDIRAKQGNFVPFILKTNLTVGILYLAVGYGCIMRQKWAFWVMLSAALLLIYTYALFYVHIHTGGLYESRTVVAMAVRLVFTLVGAGFIYSSINREI